MGSITRFGASQMFLSTLAPEMAAMPDTLWVALTSVVPYPETQGSDLIEPTGSNYQRVAYSRGGDYWFLDGLTTLTNLQSVSWPLPSTDWGRVEGWALCTLATGGDVIASGALQAAAFIVTGSTVTLPANAMRIRMEF